MRILVCVKRVPAPGARINVTVDGQAVDAATQLATLEGTVRSLLGGERTALNFLGHLAGRDFGSLEPGEKSNGFGYRQRYRFVNGHSLLTHLCPVTTT